ncbi:MAG TPA: hypothetical protein PLK94_14465 [Alphaproteobacteria bacterium]|nr:hypothetical protein [Alphaproteobacteria bacterium]
MTEKEILAISGAIIIALSGVVWWFIQHYIRSRESDRRMITDLCESVSAITARQEGQTSFAKALLEQQGKLSVLDEKMNAFHHRLDDVNDRLGDMMAIIKRTV